MSAPPNRGTVSVCEKSAQAAADLSAKQFYAVKLDGNEKFNIATTRGERVVGFLQDEPEANEVGQALILGLSKAVAGGTVTTGDQLTVDTASKVIKATLPSDWICAIAMEDAASGEVFQIFATPIGTGTGANGQIQYAEVAVTSAELLALNTTAKTLVAAQGAGYVTELLSAVLILDYNSAAYATNGDLSIRETDASGTALSDTVALADFLAKTADTIQCVQVLSADVALLANKALVLSCATGNPATGNSPIRVKVAYRVHETGL